MNFYEFAVSFLGSQVVIFSLIGLVFLSTIDTPVLPFILKAYQFSIQTTITIFDILYTIVSTVIWAVLEILRIVVITTWKTLKFIFGPYVAGNIWIMIKFGYKGFSWILDLSIDIITFIF